MIFIYVPAPANLLSSSCTEGLDLLWDFLSQTFPLNFLADFPFGSCVFPYVCYPQILAGSEIMGQDRVAHGKLWSWQLSHKLSELPLDKLRWQPVQFVQSYFPPPSQSKSYFKWAYFEIHWYLQVLLASLVLACIASDCHGGLPCLEAFTLKEAV